MRTTRILLIEDDEADAWLLQKALQECEADTQIYLIGEGQAALDFLTQPYSDNPFTTPDLIFLDLSLPKKSGMQVLQELKSNPRLRYIPVIILTHTVFEDEVDQTYHYKASAYLTKPVCAREVADIIKYQHLFAPTASQKRFNIV
ncbi:MAG: response regulator [Bacteroidota bacterium]